MGIEIDNTFIRPATGEVEPDFGGNSNLYKGTSLDSGILPSYKTEANKQIDFCGSLTNDIDTTPKYMKRVQIVTITPTPKYAIEFVIDGISKNSYPIMQEIKHSDIGNTLGLLKDQIYKSLGESCDLQGTYNGSSLFRHFIAMLKAGLLGTKGNFDQENNRVYLVGKSDTNNGDLYNVGGITLFKGIPAVYNFSKRDIDNVGDLVRPGGNVIASDWSLYNSMLKDSGYVKAPKMNKIRAGERSLDSIADGLTTYGKSNIEIANMIISSENPERTYNIVAKELDRIRLMRVERILRNE